jgi:hypothetical protein
MVLVYITVWHPKQSPPLTTSVEFNHQTMKLERYALFLYFYLRIALIWDNDGKITQNKRSEWRLHCLSLLHGVSLIAYRNKIWVRYSWNVHHIYEHNVTAHVLWQRSNLQNQIPLKVKAILLYQTGWLSCNESQRRHQLPWLEVFDVLLQSLQSNSQDSSVSIVTGAAWPRNWDLIPAKCKRSPERLWDPPSLSFSEYKELHSLG